MFSLRFFVLYFFPLLILPWSENCDHRRSNPIAAGEHHVDDSQTKPGISGEHHVDDRLIIEHVDDIQTKPGILDELHVG